MNASILTTLLLSLKVALVASLCIGLPGIALGYVLARKEFPGKGLCSALVSLPMVLPPTAVGLLLLQALGRNGPLGIDLGILLTWRAAVLAAGLMSLPLVVRTSRVAFEDVDPRLEQLARTLGFSPFQTWLRVSLPLARRGIAAALALGFTRSLGEFGATVTLAGSIPGETETLASAIFNAQLEGDQASTRALLFVALSVGLFSVWISEVLVQKHRPGANKR